MHTNEQRYKDEIIRLVENSKDEEYLRAVYTFAKNYPRREEQEQD